MKSRIDYKEQGCWRFKLIFRPPIIQYTKKSTTLQDVLDDIKRDYEETVIYLRKTIPGEDEQEMLVKYLLFRASKIDNLPEFGWIAKVDLKPL